MDHLHRMNRGGSLPEILNYLPDRGQFSRVPVLIKVHVKFLFQIHISVHIQVHKLTWCAWPKKVHFDRQITLVRSEPLLEWSYITVKKPGKISTTERIVIHEVIRYIVHINYFQSSCLGHFTPCFNGIESKAISCMSDFSIVDDCSDF